MKKIALVLLIAAFAGTAAVLVPFFISHVGNQAAAATDDKAPAKPKANEEVSAKGKGKENSTDKDDKGEGKAAAKDDAKDRAEVADKDANKDGGKEAAKDEADKAKAGASKEPKEGDDKAGSAAIKCDKETQERVGLEVQPLEAVKLRPEIIAYGRAIDPTPLATLDGDLDAAEATLQASEQASTRANTLFSSGESVSRKIVETASSQYRADSFHVQALRRRLALEWGGSIAAMDDKARGALLDDLVKDKAALIRVDVPGGESVKDDPTGAKIAVLGREDQAVAATNVAQASSIDPKAQAQGFLLQVGDPPFPIRPGVAVTAFLQLPGKEIDGVIVPRAAIVRYAGEAWAYVQSEEEEFERRRLPAGQVTEKGWFVSGALEPGDKVVTTGAQTLLASEMGTGGGGGADD
jgi:hypothetical protein